MTLLESALRLPRKKLDGLEGLLLSEETGIRLAELAATVPADRTILEVGTFKGKSTCYLGAGAKAGLGAHVVSIDPWDSSGNVNGRSSAHLYAEPATRETFFRQVGALGLDDQITHIQALSLKAAKDWRKPIGMLFIDASHLYADVKRDYEAFASWLKPGAIVAFDDYATRNKGVTQFVDELRRKGTLVDWDMSTLPLAIARVPGVAEPAPPRVEPDTSAINLSTVIMAHPKRERLIAGLQEELGGVPVVWDEKNDRWDTGRRSMLAYDNAATHQLVVQDDAILCKDFLAAAKQAISFVPDNPVSFYTGAVRPHYQYVSSLVASAVKKDTRWLKMEGPWWGVAVAIPTRYIEEMIAYGDAHPEMPNYDTRMGQFFKSIKIQCYYSVPSLVSHRTGADNPSLVPGRGSAASRVAINYIGEGTSGLDVEWSAQTTIGGKR